MEVESVSSPAETKKERKEGAGYTLHSIIDKVPRIRKEPSLNSRERLILGTLCLTEICEPLQKWPRYLLAGTPQA